MRHHMSKDQETLRAIQEILSADRWSPDTLEAIAEIMRRDGYAPEDITPENE